MKFGENKIGNLNNIKHKIEKSPILITGCARSGTSLMAGIINICGAFGGKMSGPNNYNKKGLFENIAIKQQVDKGYLKSIGMDPKGQKPLPDTGNLPIPSNWSQQVENIMLAEGYKEGEWFYKGARSCLMWPVWHYAYPNAKWIVVRRKTADIVNSCMSTAFMNAYNHPEGWLNWVHHHERCFVEMVEAGLNVKQVWPERMVRGDYEQVLEMIEWLGLVWKPIDVMEHIEPKLWKARKKQGLKIA